MRPASSLLVRAGLAVLVLAQGSIALWALLAPRAFYDDFPGTGTSWVAPLGPYDEHLVRDVGALSLALTVVLLAAAVTLERRLVLVAGAAYLAWSAPHLIYHLTADDVLSTTDRVTSEAGEILASVVAAGVVVAAARARREQLG